MEIARNLRLWRLEEAPKWAAAEGMENIKAEAEAKVNMITIPMPGTTKMHIRRNPRDEGKDPQDEEKVEREKAKVKVLIMDSN